MLLAWAIFRPIAPPKRVALECCAWRPRKNMARNATGSGNGTSTNFGSKMGPPASGVDTDATN
eukprot:9107750-Lingulodinium_polyedra.AAC.1